MLRNTLPAIAAVLMTLSSFGATLAILGIEIEAVERDRGHTYLAHQIAAELQPVAMWEAPDIGENEVASGLTI